MSLSVIFGELITISYPSRDTNEGYFPSRLIVARQISSQLGFCFGFSFSDSGLL